MYVTCLPNLVLILESESTGLKLISSPRPRLFLSSLLFSFPAAVALDVSSMTIRFVIINSSTVTREMVRKRRCRRRSTTLAFRRRYPQTSCHCPALSSHSTLEESQMICRPLASFPHLCKHLRRSTTLVPCRMWARGRQFGINHNRRRYRVQEVMVQAGLSRVELNCRRQRTCTPPCCLLVSPRSTAGEM